ncbi:MAG: SpoIIE family protein phosphatase [Bacilli bacterium]|nr:SpoIIE family protein phosphatase [Bacilli bacterium]
MKKERDSKYNDSLKKNELDANKQIALAGLVTAGVVLVLWIIFLTGLVRMLNMFWINIIFPITIVMLGSPFFVVRSKRTNQSALKYSEIINFALMIALLNIVIPKHAILAWAAVIMISAHYYSWKTTVFAYIIVAVLMAASLPFSMLLGEWDSNLMGANGETFAAISIKFPENPLPHGGVNNYDVEDRLYFLNNFNYYYPNELSRWIAAYIYYYAARLVCLTVVFVAALRLNVRTERLMISESEAIREKGRIAAELNVASDIQLSALPQYFPKINKFDVYALTHPAKEVGGDFYNCFLWEDKLLFFVADVSGKGVPAALLMMKTNTLISSILKNDDDVTNALKYTNKELTDHNEQGMFVTAIVGCLNLRTGEVNLGNAGHNPPLFKHHGKKYDYLKLPTGFVLGGLPDTKYKSVSRKFERNDILFVYTDGITEAMNEEGELFGEERLQSFLNGLDSTLTSEQICHFVNDEVHRFQGNAEQADDITMLCLKYNDIVENSSFVVPADKNEVNRVVEFVNKFLAQFEVEQKIVSQIDISIDEICSNIFNYAYKDSDKNGTIEVNISITNKVVTMHFVDTGSPFNPLEKEDPNVNLPLEERKEGGLGIYLVKKMMDSVSYHYSKNKENILTITKKVGE